MINIRNEAIRALKKKGVRATKSAVDSVVASIRVSDSCTSLKSVVTSAALAVESYTKFNYSKLCAKKAKPVANCAKFSGTSCPRCGKPMVLVNSRTRKLSYCLNGCAIALPLKND